MRVVLLSVPSGHSNLSRTVVVRWFCAMFCTMYVHMCTYKVVFLYNIEYAFGKLLLARLLPARRAQVSLRGNKMGARWGFRWIRER